MTSKRNKFYADLWDVFVSYLKWVLVVGLVYQVFSLSMEVEKITQRINYKSNSSRMPVRPDKFHIYTECPTFTGGCIVVPGGDRESLTIGFWGMTASQWSEDKATSPE